MRRFENQDCIQVRPRGRTEIAGTELPSTFSTGCLPLLSGLVLLLGSVSLPQAQPQPPAATATPDPLMSLMLSQPSIDVSTPVAATAAFDPPLVKPGEDATYRVTFNALEESVDWSGKIAAPPQLQARAGAHGQILVFGGSALQPRAVFNYHVRSTELGRFTVPQFNVSVYGKPVIVPAAELEITDSPPASIQPAQRLVLEARATNLFVGQALRVSIGCPAGASLVSQGMVPLQLAGDGFIVDSSAFRPRPEARSRLPGSLSPPGPTYETVLTPIRAGRLSAFAQGFFATRLSGALMINSAGAINGNWNPYTLLDSDPLELTVRPLPRDGQLPGFTGAIGTFTMDSLELSTNLVRVGEPVKLRVRVRGDGNLPRLVAPPPPTNPDWQVLVSPPDGTHPQVVQAQGYTTLEFTLIPLTPDTQATPRIPFSCFDPREIAYKDLTIPPVALRILPGSTPGDLRALAEANAVTPAPEKEPVLSSLAATPGVSAASLAPLQLRAWYPLLQLAPAGAFLGLWSWDRRRRYLEQHPDVVRRRRARRALRREWRSLERAARAGDAPRFGALAVSAMRVACAPHYPAEPRALVGSDVLAILSETECAGRPGQVVRRFFSVTDAERFSVVPSAAGELLALHAELAEVLQRLEERL